MRRVCVHGDVGRRLSIEGIRDEISWVWTPPLTKHSLLCWVVSGIWRLASSLQSKPSSSNTGDTMISGARQGWARCGGLSIRHLALQRQWQCRRWRHRDGVHEAGRGRQQYDVEKAEQRGVSAFAREGRACIPLLDLAHLGWTAAASGIGARRSAVRRQRQWLRRGKKDGFEFLCFTTKTVGCAVKWWSSHRVLE
jgi:hypothetical protein